MGKVTEKINEFLGEERIDERRISKLEPGIMSKISADFATAVKATQKNFEPFIFVNADGEFELDAEPVFINLPTPMRLAKKYNVDVDKMQDAYEDIMKEVALKLKLKFKLYSRSF